MNYSKKQWFWNMQGKGSEHPWRQASNLCSSDIFALSGSYHLPSCANTRSTTHSRLHCP